jgi:hypothetical protein
MYWVSFLCGPLTKNNHLNFFVHPFYRMHLYFTKMFISYSKETTVFARA